MSFFVRKSTRAIARLNDQPAIGVRDDVKLAPLRRSSSTLREPPDRQRGLATRGRTATCRLLAGVFLFMVSIGFAGRTVAQEFTFSRPSPVHSIRVDAPAITRWVSGGYEVLHLTGGVEISQNKLVMTADEAIVWVQVPDPNGLDSADLFKIIVYLEGGIEVKIPQSGADPTAKTNRIVDESWLGRLFTRGTVDLTVATRNLDSGTPEIFQRATASLEQGWASTVQQAQYAEGAQGRGANTLVNPQTGALMTVAPGPTSVVESAPFQTQMTVPNNSTSPAFAIPNNTPPGNTRPGSSLPQMTLPGAPGGTGFAISSANVNFSARDATVPLNLKSELNPANPSERILIMTGGIRVSIDSPEFQQMQAFREDKENRITILANNAVAWQTTLPDGTDRWEIYLEGNVIFSKDKRVIYAKKMYFNANANKGTILNAEVLTPATQVEGVVRLKADVIQQVDDNNLQAFGAAFTSSRLGVPRYWLQSENMLLTHQESPALVPGTNQQQFDPVTGKPVIVDDYFVESRSNRVYVSNVPVFFWPRFRANLNDPGIVLERLAIGNDNIFGAQILTGWNMFQLLGLKNRPAGVKWIGQLDYLSDRGIGLGSETTYRRDRFFGLVGPTSGAYRSWFIKDKGLDLLGRGRGNLIPEKTYRGRSIWQHRQKLDRGHQIRAEFGWISDRNFLEQYYEREWDSYKDATTGIWLERNVGTQSFNLLADYQVNDFFTQTSWLPRFDHFLIGQPLFGDRAVWHGRSQVGYGRLRVGDPPLNPSELAMWDPLAWEVNVQGVRAGTRQELDFPIQAGPAKIVPYVLGDVTYWQQALDGNDLLRGYGQLGMKASLPFWRVDPTIQSTLWNVNGLAHKVTFDVDAFFAQSSQDLDELALYDQIDDDAQEDFRRRFAFNTFGIIPGENVPLRFDERYMALRSGMQNNVTAPSTEIADDLAVVKFGARQRWQTKRGVPGYERIIDWITLDVEATYFPKAERDNFNSDFGMMDYDFRWHVGNRFTLVSDGFFDFFSQGLRTASFGMNYGRPRVGNLYLGYRAIEGPISSNVVTATAVYRMSEKWGVKGLSQVDFGETGTIGQALSFVYIGESFLWQFGVNADLARDNVGFRFGFEPRFTKRSRIFNPGGVGVGPAGSRWLE